MNFMIQGSPTPRNGQRDIPGSARSRQQNGRPDSAKPKFNRNPITGAETPIPRPASRTDPRPVSRTDPRPASRTDPRPASRRPDGVPELDLHCFKVEPKTVLPEVYDYPLDTGRSGVSTISWGTDTDRSYQQSVRSARVPSARQHESPYHLQLQDEPPQEKPKTRENDVDEEIRHMKKKTYGEIRKEVEDEDFLDQSWSKRKPMSQAGMLKKMDAEELLEYNKKQKLIETVMLDQLSRAVISDPDQNSRISVPVSERPHRGSQRMLHDTKIRTKNTTTENMLSKRVRFGARILTRNGHDAMRELTGFFFHFDNTLTIYEFRQFGKSAKALPFIVRGRYAHLEGPREDDPYNLMDIYSGNQLIIETRGQHSLPDTLKKKERVYFKITDVDEEERHNLLLEDFAYTTRSEDYAKLNAQNKQEYLNKRILEGVQEAVRERLTKRGIKTITGLGRYYRKLDKSGSGILYKFELEKGLFTYHIELPPQDLDCIFDVLDPDERGELDYSIYMRGVIGEMEESRKNLVRKAFRKIDSQKRGTITINEIRKYFNASFQPPYKQGATPGVSSLKAFLDGIQSSPNQEEISYVEFEEYYEGLSISIDNDMEFANILHNTWNI